MFQLLPGLSLVPPSGPWQCWLLAVVPDASPTYGFPIRSNRHSIRITSKHATSSGIPLMEGLEEVHRTRLVGRKIV